MPFFSLFSPVTRHSSVVAVTAAAGALTHSHIGNDFPFTVGEDTVKVHTERKHTLIRVHTEQAASSCRLRVLVPHVILMADEGDMREQGAGVLGDVGDGFDNNPGRTAKTPPTGHSTGSRERESIRSYHASGRLQTSNGQRQFP